MTIGLRTFGLLSMAALPLLLAGCGEKSQQGRPDILATPRDELHGAAMKSLLYEFRAKVRKRGAAAAKQELPTLLENFEGYEKQPVGQHLDTYKQIVEKLKALETTVAGAANQDQVRKVAEEIGTLADKLPGKANQNPEVE